MENFLIIDGNSIANRSFYGIRHLTNKKGIFTNATTGFFNTLLKLKSETGATRIAVCFDLRAPTFRHEMYEGYKKSRKGMPEELAMQIPYIKQILDFMGIMRVELAGYEADDLIGTLAQTAAQIIIATGDRDAFQLINENVSVRLASTKEEITYTPEKITEVYGIKPAQFIEIKALMGDSSDDIPGVAGIGEKTAFSLIQKYKSVFYIYDHISTLDLTAAVRLKLELGRDMAFLSRELATIATNAPIDLTVDAYRIQPGNSQKLAEVLSELEMYSLLKKLELKPVALLDEAKIDPRIVNLEAKLELVLRDMEKAGIKIDVKGMARFGQELIPQINKLTRQIHKLAGQEFNIKSPKQLGEILYDKFGLQNPQKGSTSAEVLEIIAADHKIIPLILEYRSLTKLDSTYVKGIMEHVGENGRVHTTFKNETATGRLSSVNPNIQNIPIRTERGRNLRRFFIADKGNLLIDADYSQIELRILAHVADDKAMLAAFKNNADIHAITAMEVFGDAKMRAQAKAVNFGIVYGMGAFRLAKEIDVPLALAREYIEKYLDKYSGVREYLKKIVEQAKTEGFVTTMLGRARQIHEIRSSNHNVRAAGERIAKNTPIQGTAADIIKIAMVRVHEKLADSPAKLILQVHDELIVEAPEHHAEKTAEILRKEMVAAGSELDIDLTVDIGIGKSWYEC
jgi:DNA polymerase I-like protein with 3'-5' exonuclease and polymerase domains